MHTFIGLGVPYGLKQPYETLLNELDDKASMSNCGLVKTFGRFERSENDNSRVVFNSFVRLANWAARATSDKESVDIIIHIQETIHEQQHNKFVLERSTVRVSYFTVEGQEAKLLHGIHFDYGPEQQSHPIFHAQLTNETVDLSAETAKELEFSIQQVSSHKPFKNARIPTSDMTMPSVLLCLAADHIKSDFFGEFLSRVKVLQEQMPQPTFGKTCQSIQAAPHHIRSSHWFAHTPGI